MWITLTLAVFASLALSSFHRESPRPQPHSLDAKRSGSLWSEENNPDDHEDVQNSNAAHTPYNDPTTTKISEAEFTHVSSNFVDAISLRNVSQSPTYGIAEREPSHQPLKIKARSIRNMNPSDKCQSSNTNVYLLEWLGPFILYNCLDDLESLEEVLDFLLDSYIDEDLLGAAFWYCRAPMEGQSFLGFLRGDDCFPENLTQIKNIREADVRTIRQTKTPGECHQRKRVQSDIKRPVLGKVAGLKRKVTSKTATDATTEISMGEKTSSSKVTLLDIPNGMQRNLRIKPSKTEIYDNAESPHLDEDDELQSLLVDCGPHGSDYKLPSSALQGLNALLEFTLSCVGMNDPLPSDLLNYPSRSINKVIIQDTSLESLPEALFQGCSAIEEIRLNNNLNFVRLPPKLFRNLNTLEYLDISDNNISFIDATFFKDTILVYDLDLSNNSLELIADGLFESMKQLQTLNLDSNRIKTISKGMFHGLDRLRSISLKNNYIANLPGDVFSDMLKTLHVIDIRSNSLRELHSDLFTTSDSNNQSATETNPLKTIYLGYNKLSSLPNTLFHKSLKLNYLYMEHNSLTALPKDIFVGLSSLLMLNLSCNQLRSLPGDLFIDNTKLIHLYLSDNQLKKLPEGIFRSQSNLMELTLRNNKASVLSEDPIDQPLTKLVKVDLGDMDLKEASKMAISVYVNAWELLLDGNKLGSASDEEGAEGSTLADGIFHSFIRLWHLDISRNSLLWLRENVFQDMKNLKRLDAAENRLMSIPSFPLNLPILDLSHNRLWNISLNKHFKGMGSLKFLNLSYNAIKQLNLHEWNEVPKLDRLELQNNILSWIGPLQRNIGSWNVTYLDLSNNNLTLKENRDSSHPFAIDGKASFSDDIFNVSARMSPLNHLTKLKTLILSYNNISNMFLDWSWYMEDLQFLDLRGNHLVELTAYDLLYASSSIQIDLRDNDIEAVILPQKHLKDPDVVLCKNNKDGDSIGEDNEYFYHRNYKYPHKKSTNSITTRGEQSANVCQRNRNINGSRMEKLKDTSPKNFPGAKTPKNSNAFDYISDSTVKRINTSSPIQMDIEMILDGNPFACGCNIFTLLRYIAGEKVLHRKKFHAASITSSDTRPLTCATPTSVSGKPLQNVEEWMYHLLPLMSICHALGQLGIAEPVNLMDLGD